MSRDKSSVLNYKFLHKGLKNIPTGIKAIIILIVTFKINFLDVLPYIGTFIKFWGFLINTKAVIIPKADIIRAESWKHLYSKLLNILTSLHY